MTLIDGPLLKLWSVRFSLLVSIFGVGQTAWAFYDGRSLLMPALVFLIGVAFLVLRILKQPDLKAEAGFEVDTAEDDKARVAEIAQAAVEAYIKAQAAGLLKAEARGDV
jgi:hypothetical protein